ncbi:MAG: superoxide dismutase [Planctomycetota bacterium]
MALSLPALPYDHAALEPHIDARTMEIHHGKHHQAYVDKANVALEGSGWADKPIEAILADLGSMPDSIRGPVRNNAGGHANHSLFWQVMAPAGSGGGGAPSGALASAIDDAFGSLDAFKDKFAAAGASRFGSGWAWLVAHQGGKVAVGSTPNQDTPLMGEGVAGLGGTPILGLDVWEHAYYLNYQNRRPDYIKAFWEVVNWSKVSELYDAAK